MKTSKSNSVLRVLVASIVLLGAAFQTNVAEASCNVSKDGATFTCSGDESTCRVDGLFGDAVVCSGSQMALKVETQKASID